MPSRIASGFSPSFDARWGFDPAKTQYVALTRGIQIWLVPGSQSVCMVQSGPMIGRPAFRHVLISSSCTSVENAVSSPFPWGGEPGPGNTRAWIGLVPDGATVTVTTRAGATVKVPVVDNVGYVTSSSGFRSARIRYADGRTATSGL